MGLSQRLERWKLARKQERLILTWRGCFLFGSLALAAVLMAASLFIHRIAPFLAPTAPVPGAVLVVEGWIPDYNNDEVRTEFERSGKTFMIVTGNPLPKGEALSEYKNFADLTRAEMLRRGWKADQVIAVASPEALRDRTYAAACQLRRWLLARPQLGIGAINIMSFGVHTRRTWLLYKKALKGVADVGMIAGRDLRFDSQHWWRTSEGVRATIDETVAYLYARCFFSPPPLCKAPPCRGAAVR